MEIKPHYSAGDYTIIISVIYSLLRMNSLFGLTLIIYFGYTQIWNNTNEKDKAIINLFYSIFLN